MRFKNFETRRLDLGFVFNNFDSNYFDFYAIPPKSFAILAKILESNFGCDLAALGIIQAKECLSEKATRLLLRGALFATKQSPMLLRGIASAKNASQ
ncbi:hypothetical protein JW964_07990 [candidate division KSB1 bacterium]|nr:hypothetical protein [candidate division KSB1 bacterium]